MNDSELPEIPPTVARVVSADVRLYGRRNLETGGFLLMNRDASAISAVALGGDAGIVRRRNLFQISGLALAQLFTYLDREGLWAPIQYHSHANGAFLSSTDEAHGLCVEGFVSAVGRNFAQASDELTKWGWWRFTDGEWTSIKAATYGSGPAAAVKFDEDGVRAA